MRIAVPIPSSKLGGQTPALERMLGPQSSSLCRRGKSCPGVGMVTTLSHTSGKNLIYWVLPPDLARPTERLGGSGGLGFLASLCLMEAGPQGHSLTLEPEPVPRPRLGWRREPSML